MVWTQESALPLLPPQLWCVCVGGGSVGSGREEQDVVGNPQLERAVQGRSGQGKEANVVLASGSMLVASASQ